MYIHSEDLRKIEQRARELRAEQMRKIVLALFSRSAPATTPRGAKTA